MTLVSLVLKNVKTVRSIARFLRGGEGGSRTLDTLERYTRFRVWRIRPLCHLSTKNGRGYPNGCQLNGQECNKKSVWHRSR